MSSLKCLPQRKKGDLMYKQSPSPSPIHSHSCKQNKIFHHPTLREAECQISPLLSNMMFVLKISDL